MPIPETYTEAIELEADILADLLIKPTVTLGDIYKYEAAVAQRIQLGPRYKVLSPDAYITVIHAR
jgi:hypothetical protein